ncbi:UNVERIFIED_CONTAM: Vacuolar protein-sorting-associated protein 27 [Siphonaria sp. JEL0065]|nr:Vacuolar protein-sorting-associated protein 27 [Siphonaria sp. JEL0065]
MSLFFGANPIDELIEKATSENLPLGSEDVYVNLEIADKIKSKQTPAKYAAQAIKKRLVFKNPNVQLLAIKLVDTCAKNSGSHFLVEVAAKDFMDTLVGLGGSLQLTDLAVRKAALALIQNWGLSFKGKPELSYACEIYNTLKRVPFPPVEHAEVSSIMIDTTTTAPLPLLGITEPVRVCDGCHLKLVAKAAGAISTPTGGNTPYRSDSVRHVDAAARKEQEDIEKAIAASLASSGSAPAPNPAPAARKVNFAADDEEDEDLKAAIEASLRDLKIAENSSNSKSGISYPSTGGSTGGSSFAGFGGYGEPALNQSSPTASTAAAATLAPAPNANELSRIEIDNLKLFADLVERMEADVQQRGIGVMSHSQISTLYGQLFALQPKLQWSLDDAVGKYRKSMEINEKVSDSLQMYDRILQERLNARNVGGYGAPPQQFWNAPPQQGYYNQQPYAASQGSPQPLYANQPPPQQQGWAPGYTSDAGFAGPSQQQYAPPPQQEFAPPPLQQGYAPPQQEYAAPSQQCYAPPPQQDPNAYQQYPQQHQVDPYQQQQQQHAPPGAPGFAPPQSTGYPVQPPLQPQQQPQPQPTPPRQPQAFEALQGLQFAPTSVEAVAAPPQTQPQQYQQPPQDPQYTYSSSVVPPQGVPGGLHPQHQPPLSGYQPPLQQPPPQAPSPAQEAPLIEF